MARRNRERIRQHVDRKLVTRLRMFSVIFVVMFGVVVVDVVLGRIGVLLAGLGLLIGFGVGLVVSRMNHIRWDEEGSRVVGQIDKVGAVILLAYLVFSFSRNWLFGHWAEGATLAALTLSVSAGSMLGRITGTRAGIRRTLEAWEIVPPRGTGAE